MLKTLEKEEIDLHYEEAIRAGILSADEGLFHSKESIFKWMDSWFTDNPLPAPEPDIDKRKTTK
jgi:predicted transcriptional regulator